LYDFVVGFGTRSDGGVAVSRTDTTTAFCHFFAKLFIFNYHWDKRTIFLFVNCNWVDTQWQ